MYRKIQHILQTCGPTYNVPTATGGLALAIASLGWCFENVLHELTIIKPFSAFIASVLIIMITAKFIAHPNIVKDELAHPVISSVMPTYAMALMVISHSLYSFSMKLGELLWLVAIVIHCLFLISFIYYRIKIFELSHMLPSWFIPPIGLIVANVTFTGNAVLYPLAKGILYFGLICYAIMLPIMIYRLVFAKAIDQENKPTLAVLAAPASLSLVGYLSMTSEPLDEVVIVLLVIAIAMTLTIYLAFIKLLRLPFSPAFAAFTFPTVISSTALFKVIEWMQQHQFNTELVFQMRRLAQFEFVIAFLIVSYVSLKYVAHFRTVLRW